MACHPEQPFTAEQEDRIREMAMDVIEARTAACRRRDQRRAGIISRMGAILQADEVTDD